MMLEGIPFAATQSKFFGRVEKKIAVVKVEYIPEKSQEPSPDPLSKDNTAGSQRSPKMIV